MHIALVSIPPRPLITQRSLPRGCTGTAFRAMITVALPLTFPSSVLPFVRVSKVQEADASSNEVIGH